MAINKSENESSEAETSDEDVLSEAIERFKLAEEAWSEIYRAAEEDLEFLSGEQWPQEIRRAREHERRPCLTINRLPQFLRQVTNDQRQNRPSIKVAPVDDKADVETAKILQGMIRHIERNSRADAAYDTAFEGAAGQSFGFYRVMTDYVSPLSFDQEIKIGRIPNPFMVYLDPFSKEPDGSDAAWGFIFEDVSEDVFKADYKDSELGVETDWHLISEVSQGWVTKNSCRVAEYFYKTFKDVTLVQIQTVQQNPDGTQSQVLKTVDKKDLPKDFPKEQIINERKTTIPSVSHCKINGVEILEKTTFPSKWIPIIPVYGNELIVKGKRILEGLIRHAKDSQKMLNFWVSAETEMIALAPKAPYLVAEGQIPKEFEHMWRNSNTETYAYLPYKATDSMGRPMPAPQRNVYEPPVQAITQARMQSADDLKATTGIYDSALGAQSREISGIAIRGRQAQSQTSNFHFIDNLTRSIRHGGRIIVDMIPKIYDTARAARIIGEEDQEEIVRINEYFEKNGKRTIYDPGVGTYDVDVETGPSFATKRQEALASMIDLTKTYPQIMQIAGDLMVKNMDWPGAQEIAERMKKTLPPGMADDSKGKDQPQIPPEIQAKMQQLMQQNQQLTEHLTAITEDVKTKKNELESKERIEYAKLDVQMQIERLKLMGSAASAAFDAELASIQRHEEADLSPQEEPQEQNSIESGSPAATQNIQQQPTGGTSPGLNTGV